MTVGPVSGYELTYEVCVSSLRWVTELAARLLRAESERDKLQEFVDLLRSLDPPPRPRLVVREGGS